MKYCRPIYISHI